MVALLNRWGTRRVTAPELLAPRRMAAPEPLEFD